MGGRRIDHWVLAGYEPRTRPIEILKKRIMAEIKNIITYMATARTGHTVEISGSRKRKFRVK